MARLIVANLDAERSWAAHTYSGVPALTPAVLSRISRYGTLLSVLAPDADTLWTPAPVDPAVRVELEGWPHPALATGPLPDLPRREVCAWAEAHPLPDTSATGQAAKANDKARQRRFARAQGGLFSLPGTDEIRTLAAFHDVPVSREGWVIKPRFGTAGRGQIRGHGRRLDGPTARRIERVLAQQGALPIEPWVDRRADVGAVWEVDCPLRLHRQVIDERGRFSGVRSLRPGELLDAHEAWVEEAIYTLRQAYLVDGHPAMRPLGIDALTYHNAAGRLRFHAFVEGNARYTFGHVFHAFAPAAEAAFGADVPYGLYLQDALVHELPPDVRVLLQTPGTPHVHAWLAPLR